MKKLFLTTVTACVLFSGVAYAADPWPIVANMILPPEAKLTDVYGLDYYSSGRATGKVPPKPDSVSVTVNSNGTSSVTSTYDKR